LFLALVSVACAKQDDAEKLRKSADSWRATLQLVADARLRNTVPKRFARITIEEAIDDLSGQTARPSIPRLVAVRAERIIGIAASLHDAVENDDRAAIARARGELGR
jgi:GH15 family glucan-1,4-alpha-glucosidase